MKTKYANKLISVCLVDDEIEILESLIPIFDQSFDVRAFFSPIEALKAIEKGFIPEIIISDLKMIEMNGIEFVAQLRERQINSKVVIFSGYFDTDLTTAAVDLKIDGFLEKPFTARDFTDVLERIRL